MFLRYCLIILFFAVAQGDTLTDFDFLINPDQISVDTLTISSTSFHKLTIPEFTNVPISFEAIGCPELPYVTSTFLLPPDICIESIHVTEMDWETYPGNYYLIPSQASSLINSSFTTAYTSPQYFPASPVSIVKQGSVMGFSIVTIAGYPLRYSPVDSSLQFLTDFTLSPVYKSAEISRITPLRETRWSAANRLRGISSIISNPEVFSSYISPEVIDNSGRVEPLGITEFPSPEGDCVDMIVITSEALEESFSEFADYRTKQGIITAVRTVEWIASSYSGADTQERIRNFLIDAHINWGIQAVVLGGDDNIVPARQCNGWNYSPSPYPSYMLPSDDYYSDIDGNWSSTGVGWQSEVNEHYLDLCLGRWPVNTESDVDLLFMKIKLYEQPEQFPQNFARKMLLIGSNNPSGDGASDMMEIVERLEACSAVPELLDDPSTLYYPHSLSGGDLNRVNTLEELNLGYNLILHADHSEIHKLATAGKGTLGQFLWDSDFSGFSNIGQLSILWTLGCDTGHFDGAYCYTEASLLTSSTTGMVAVMANARGGLHAQKITLNAFVDALYNTGYIQGNSTSHSLHWPLSYLGEAYRCSKNTTNLSFEFLNLFGSPLMYVWRDDPLPLSVSTSISFLSSGTVQNIPVTVAEGSNPVEGATVCIWKENEIFAVEQTNESGEVLFSDVALSDDTTNLFVTATKRRKLINSVETEPADYIPAQIEIDVLPSTIPIVVLSDFIADPEGNGSVNPGETVDLHIVALNTGYATATDVSVEMLILSGDEFIDSVINSYSSFADISPSDSSTSNSPIQLSIKKNIPNNSLIEAQLTFTYSNQESDDFTWNSGLLVNISSDNYSLTSLASEVSVERSEDETVSIDLSNFILANTGLSSGADLEITVSNVFPSEPYSVNTFSVPSILPNRTLFLNDSLNLSITPGSEDSEWLKGLFQNCFIDITVSAESGEFIARHLSIELVNELQNVELYAPSDLQIVESGEDYLTLDWYHDGNVFVESYYIYCNDGVSNTRVFPLPVPTSEVTIDGLLPGRNYTIGVTALDVIGRESEIAQIEAETSCPRVDGWPLYLNGSPGGGAIAADIDSDGFDEIVVASSSGIVYLIERNGETSELYPPPDFLFNRILGSAVADVDGDGKLEIIVSCQQNFEEEGSEKIVLLLFDSFSGFWSSEVIAETDVNEEAASPDIAGTPVLFQADNSSALEIALRSRGNNGGTPHLYVWKFDSSSGEWISYSEAFPVSLQGWFSNSPTAVDFDNDNIEELIVTNYGTGTNLIIADFEPDGSVSISNHELSEINTGGYSAKAFGTIAAAEQDNTFYLAGVAKPDEQSSLLKKVFVYVLEKNPDITLSLQWQSDWLSGIENYGNMPGPAIGDINSDDNNLEVVYTLNGGTFSTEGIVKGWDLQYGNTVFTGESISFNPILGEGGGAIKSQPAIALSTTSSSGAMTIFTGFSSGVSGFNPDENDLIISGFPVCTRDAAWATPVLCDLDNNTIPEVLHIDASGCATLYDYQDGIYTPNGWHMYQDNPRRTGFYNADSPSNKLDIDLQKLQVISCGLLSAEIEISNSGILPNYNSENSVRILNDERATSALVLQNEANCTEIAAFSDMCANLNLINETVTVSLFTGHWLICSELISVYDGTQTISIDIPEEFMNSNNFTVVVDPFNNLNEQNERNNSLAVDASLINTYLFFNSVSVPTPSDKLSVQLELTENLPDGISIRVYSLDGRIVHQTLTEPLSTGFNHLNLTPETQLPNGIYTVILEGFNFPLVIRKIMILQ